MNTSKSGSNDESSVGHDAADQCRLLLLMDHSLDFIQCLGSNGVILGISSAITSLAGYEPQELVGRPYENLIHPDDCALAAKAFAEVMACGHAGPITLRYRSKAGDWRTIEARARDYRADPAARAIVVATRDVTDQIQAESLLSQANTELHRLSQLLLSAQEAERSHLARELHDDAAQMLTALSLHMSVGHSAASESPTSASIETWRGMVRDVLDRLRALIENLRPAALDQIGLAAAVGTHTERVRSMTGMNIQLDVDADLGPLPPEVELTCFRIVQEAIMNAVKHSGATLLRVRLRRLEGALEITIADDGRGFDVASTSARAARGGRIGLLSMRERALLVGGQFDVVSEPGRGTEVRAVLPC
jgi:two-component system sensor histidine kinase UhpB